MNKNLQDSAKVDSGFMRTLTGMIARSRLAGLFGQRFEGRRDYAEVFGYEGSLSYDKLLAKYLRQGIASRIVDAPAQGLWDDPPEVTSNSDEWNKAWNRLTVKHNLWQTLLRLDKLCGLGSYACLMVGVKGTGASDRPVPARSGAALREVLYFQVYSQRSAVINKVSGDSTSTQFMLPEVYSINPNMQNEGQILPGMARAPGDFKVHHSRILHVAENILENAVYGSPRLERVFNDLDDMLKVSGGTAETVWLTSNRGMQIDLDKDMELTPEDAKNLTDEMDEYMHQLRRYVRTRGIKMNPLGSEVPDTTGIFNILISLISGATGIPRRILIGAEAGQLASDQDRANWAERITFRRKEFGEPQFIFPLISLLTSQGVLPAPDDLEIQVIWPDAHKMSPLEMAQKNAQHARSATNFASAIDKLVKIKNGTPAVPEALDAEGNSIPGTGTEGVAGEDYMEILNPDWVKTMLGQDPKRPRIDDPGDLPTL